MAPPLIALESLALPDDLEWLAAVASLRARPFFWWLDSARIDPRLGRYSYAGADPYFLARARGQRFELEVLRPVRDELPVGRTVRFGDPLAQLEALLPEREALPGDPPLPFLGGAVGYLGYELAEQLEALTLTARDDLGLPDLCFLGVDSLIAIDHLEDRAYALGLGFAGGGGSARERARSAAEAIRDAVSGGSGAAPILAVPPRPRSTQGPETLFDRESYGKAVRRAIDAIEAGDVYQVCLTHRLELPGGGDPFAVYQALRAKNPAPFAAYLELPGASILSSSPERFLSLGPDRWAESRPIKGTRPRAADPLRDRALARELSGSAKDGAENLMIVDLVRNDFGRVCETGSVHVPELRVIEDYATVFQMVSTVRGRLRAECSCFDLLRASFPPGSMTGAPKIAAMEILDTLEPVRRGPYSGALGYLDLRGGAGLSVVIRAAIVAGGRAMVHVGGGIVADSEPGAEWLESWDKARALLEAFGIASLSGSGQGR